MFSVAEHTIGLILAALKRMVYSDREIKRGDFTAVQTQLRTEGIHELRHQHVGLVGCGANWAGGLACWGYLAARSVISIPIDPPLNARALNISYLELDDLLAQCDIVSLHVPVLPDTVNIIINGALGLMKDHAILVNTSRGELIDQPAAASAVKAVGWALWPLTPSPRNRRPKTIRF